MRAIGLFLAATTAILLGLPTGVAHFEGYSETTATKVGPYSVVVEPSSNPIYARDVAQLAITAYGDDGRPARVEPQLNVTLPNGTTYTMRTSTLTPGYATAVFRPPVRGNYTLLIDVTDANGTYNGTTSIDVYPDLGFALIPIDPYLDVTTNTPTTVRFQTVDPDTNFPNTTLKDITIRIQHWSDDHTTLTNTTELPLRSEGASTWALDFAFPERGMYHMGFRSDSGNIPYEDIPILHTFATDPVVSPSVETPAPGTLLVLSLLAGLALTLTRR